MNEGDRKNTQGESLNQRGIELADRGWLEEALSEFQRAIRANPDSPFPHINRASVFMEQGRILEALEDLMRAVRLAPEDAATHFHLGLFFCRFGHELGKSELLTSLAQEPDQVDALLQLAAVHLDQAEFAEAEGYLVAALEVDNTDPLTHREMGIYKLEQGQVHQAIQHLRYAREQLPDDAEIEVDLGLAYIQAGFLDQAEKLLQSASQRHPDNLQAHYNLAAIYADRKDEQAFDHLQRAAAINQNRVKNWLRDDPMFEKFRRDDRLGILMDGPLPSE